MVAYSLRIDYVYIQLEENAMSHKYKILIIDDDEIFREFLNHTLKNDFQVIEAKDGIDGIEKAKESDLIITDIVMPGMNGLELITNLRTNFKNPIFVISGSSVAPEMAFEFGADLFLQKPFNPQILKKYIESSLKKVEQMN